MAREGSVGAAVLLDLKKNPDRFLAAVQVGVTIVGATASAIGGATAVEILKPFVASLPIPFIEHYAEAVSITSIVVLISYVSLVFGELIPKSIALRDPERFGAMVARPVRAFQSLSSVVINFLTGTTNLIMKPFGGKAFSERSFVTEEEIKLLVMEGRESGVFDSDEQELIHSVFEFTDTSVKEVMVPIGQALTIDFDTPLEKALKIIAEEQFSRYPVYGGETNDIKGVLYAKDVFKFLAQGIDRGSTPPPRGATLTSRGVTPASGSSTHASGGAAPASIRKLLRAPFYVPETMMISSLLRDMQKRRMHMAIAVNEHGLVTGIVTIEDLLEEIVGEIRDEHDTERPVIEIAPGTYIVYASINLRDLKEDYGIALPESPQYDTLGGFVITELQRIPDGGEVIELGGAAAAGSGAGGAGGAGGATHAGGNATAASNGMKLTVLEMVSKRVSKVKVELHEVGSHGRDRTNGAIQDIIEQNKT